MEALGEIQAEWCNVRCKAQQQTVAFGGMASPSSAVLGVLG